MVEFVTLLLGLVVGTQAVEVSVSDDVARVEFHLDGETVKVLDEPPWFANCDFGTELAPHELIAVAYDPEGRELSTARQWVNLPRRRIEARLSLERTAGDRASARLIWSSLDPLGKPAVELTFDGKSLAFDDLERVALPPHEPGELHFLRAALRFSAAESAFAELVFGGSFGDLVSTELTALPVLADKRLPRAVEMEGWFEKRGRPLRVVAVEHGPVNLLVVRERSLTTQNRLRFLHQRFEAQRSMTRLPRPAPRVLDGDDRIRFVFPTLGREPVAVGEGLVRLDTEQIPVSLALKVEVPRARRRGQTPRPGQPPPLPGDEIRGFRSLFEILTNAFYTGPEAPAAVHRLADAVAIAGLVAATGNQRRLVLLMVSGDSSDSSRFRAAEVRAYLEKLRVPLTVWTIPGGNGSIPAAVSRWGESRDVSELKAMHHALDELRKNLQSQALVWIEGAHLRHEIELTAKARGLRPLVEDRENAAADAGPSAGARNAAENESWPVREIGHFTLRSQVQEGGLIELLDRVAGHHSELFARRYGVDAGPIRGEILLFARERDYLEFKRSQGHARVEVRATGYFESPALVVLQRGRSSRHELAASLLHELTHLLSWHVLGEGTSARRALPPWLEEGLADDLSLASLDRRRGLVAAPLGPGNLHYGRRLGDVLREVAEKIDSGSAPSLSELTTLDRAAFLAGDGQLHYLLSALWVRYFLEGAGGELAEGFRAFLRSIAAGGSPVGGALLSRLEREEWELERGFRGWLEQLRRRLPPQAE